MNAQHFITIMHMDRDLFPSDCDITLTQTEIKFLVMLLFMEDEKEVDEDIHKFIINLGNKFMNVLDKN